MIAILTLVLGLLIGLYVSHHCLVVPLWKAESGLRKELGKLRREEYVSFTTEWIFTKQATPAIKTRAHSKVLFIPHPEDLFR